MVASFDLSHFVYQLMTDWILVTMFLSIVHTLHWMWFKSPYGKKRSR